MAKCWLPDVLIQNYPVPMHRSTEYYRTAAELKRDMRTSSIQPPPRSRWSRTRLLIPVLHLPIAKETPQSFWTAFSCIWASSQGEIFPSVENFPCVGFYLWPLVLSLESCDPSLIPPVRQLKAADVIPGVEAMGPGDTRHGLFSRAVGLQPAGSAPCWLAGSFFSILESLWAFWETANDHFLS